MHRADTHSERRSNSVTCACTVKNAHLRRNDQRQDNVLSTIRFKQQCKKCAPLRKDISESIPPWAPGRKSRDTSSVAELAKQPAYQSSSRGRALSASSGCKVESKLRNRIKLEAKKSNDQSQKGVKEELEVCQLSSDDHVNKQRENLHASAACEKNIDNAASYMRIGSRCHGQLKTREDLQSTSQVTLKVVKRRKENAGRSPLFWPQSYSTPACKPSISEGQNDYTNAKMRSAKSRNQANRTGGVSDSLPLNAIPKKRKNPPSPTLETSHAIKPAFSTKQNGFRDGKSLSELERPLKEQRRCPKSISVGGSAATEPTTRLIKPAEEILCLVHHSEAKELSLRETLEDMRQKCELLEHTSTVGEYAQHFFEESIRTKMITPEVWCLPEPSLSSWKSACVLLAGNLRDEMRETSETCCVFGTKDRKQTAKMLRSMEVKFKKSSTERLEKRGSDEYLRNILARWSRRLKISDRERNIAGEVLDHLPKVFQSEDPMKSTIVAVSLYVALSETRKSLPVVQKLIQNVSGVAASTFMSRTRQVMKNEEFSPILKNIHDFRDAKEDRSESIHFHIPSA